MSDQKPWESYQDQGATAEGDQKPWESFGGETKPEGKGVSGHIRDLGVSVLNSAIAVPEMAVGLGDIITGGRTGKAAERLGFRPGEAKEISSDWRTDQYKQQQQDFQEADGVLDKVGVAVTNPSLVANAVVESLGSMGAGGVVARGLGAARGGLGRGIGAGAAGEGAAMAGAQAEEIRQQTDDGLLTPEQVGYSLATGGLGSLFGFAGGRLAQKLGIGDVDTMLARGVTPDQVAADLAAAPAKSIPRQVIEGAISEGFLEELPQSVSETILQNLALDRHWSEGIEDAAVMDTLAGMAMGGAGAGYSGYNNRGADTSSGLPDADIPPAGDAPKGFAPSWNTPPAVPEQYRRETLSGQQPMRAPKPSEVMGLNPDSGPLSSAAATAVDTGVSQQIAQQETLAQAAQVAAQTQDEQPQKPKQEVQQRQQQPTLGQGEVIDPETGEVTKSAEALQQRLDYINSQAKVNGWTNVLVNARTEAATELNKVLQEQAGQKPAVEPETSRPTENQQAVQEQSERTEEAQETEPDLEKAADSAMKAADAVGYYLGTAAAKRSIEDARTVARKAKKHASKKDVSPEKAAEVWAIAGRETAMPEPEFTTGKLRLMTSGGYDQKTNQVFLTTDQTEYRSLDGDSALTPRSIVMHEIGHWGLFNRADEKLVGDLFRWADGASNDHLEVWHEGKAGHAFPKNKFDDRDEMVAETYSIWKSGGQVPAEVVPMLQELDARIPAEMQSKALEFADQHAEKLKSESSGESKGKPTSLQEGIEQAQANAAATEGDSAISDADGYKARSSDRLERINKATSKDEIDEILKEHASDPAGHADGYSRMEAKAKDAKRKIDNPPRTDLVEGYTNPSPRQAQMDVDRLNETNPGHELVRMQGEWGEYYAIKKPSASQGKGQESRSPEQADDPKRAKALARINSEKGAFFFSEQKAQAFIDSNGLSNEYALEQQGRAFKVVPKSENAEPAAQQAAREARSENAADGPSESQAINDFIVGRRPDVPTTAEVDAELQPAALESDTAAKDAERFANNKLFTADKVAAARARMKSKFGQLNSGTDPEMLVDGMTIAGAYIESGVRNFTQYAKAMVEDFGDGVKPYLLSFWEGARNYPGLDTKDMTSPEESRRQFEALVTLDQGQAIAPEAVGEVAEKPKKRARKTGARGDMVLTQDWGVEHIDGYGTSPDRETGNDTKDAFLKETRNYLNAVADSLRAFGYEPHMDRKGKPERTVSVDESGVAGSGDVTLTMHNPETGNNVYIHIGDSTLRGVVPTTPSGIAVMYRVGTGTDRYAAKAGNTWAPVDLSANELAQLINSRAQPATESEPAAAPEAGDLVSFFHGHLQRGTLPKDNRGLRKMVSEHDSREADNARLKEAQESLEAAMVRHAREVVAEGGTDAEVFGKLLQMYSDQPSLNIRTSTSVENQAYSTPAPLAFLSARLAGIDQNSRVYEPTAGNGMLLITADPANATANELEDLRYQHLVDQGFAAIQGDAMNAIESGAVVEKSQDAVITNPPFGSVKNEDGKATKVKVDGYSIGKIDHLIAAEALKAMKDDGKATLIIGADKKAGGVSTDDRIFFNWLYSNYNVTGHFEVDGKLYSRQGASWPVRVITINGRAKSSNVSPAPGVIKRFDNWEDIYGQFDALLDAQQRGAQPDAADGRANEPQAADDAAATPATDAGQADRPVRGGRREGRGARAGNVSGAVSGADVDPSAADAAGVAAGADGQRPDERANAQDQLEPGDNRDSGKPARNQRSAGGSVAAQPAGNALADADNAFQTKYEPRSARKDEGVLVPINMAKPLQDALSALEDHVGDIDQYAASELGYESVEELHDALMGLQVDSVASAIFQIKERGKGVIIADQTGIGKGRQAASLIRWAARNNYTPVFVTVKPALFTDMYGDLADIGTHDIEPLIMNSGEWISSPSGEKLFANKAGEHRKVLASIAGSGQLPEGRNALFMTYSQINTDNVQRQALAALAPRAIFILDESHNAGGESNTGIFMRETLQSARGAVYLSATYAKRPDNMPVYFKTDIGAAISDSGNLMDAMSSGGLPLQTVVANNLVKAGQMFRRERSYDGVSIETKVDSANRVAHEKLSDEVTTALRAIVDADREFHTTFVVEAKEDAKKRGEALMDVAGNRASESVNHTEFSSVVHNFVRQMLLGLTADTAAEEALDALRRGEKPLIALENTMGSFLAEYAESNDLSVGDPLGTFDYRSVLSRALDRTRYIVRSLPNGEKVKEYIGLERLDMKTREAYEQAQEIIDGLRIDIPVSPLDWIRHRVESAGYKIAEITGRNLSVDYSGAQPVLSQVPMAEQRDKVNTTRMFNDGSLDAIILNVSGSTGISLHASERFADQRPRRMIIAQAAQDINIFMQMLGRIHRTGQVKLPAYTILNPDLPAVKRPTAILNQKMKSLNANTSSNTESATSIKSADMLNKYGDQVVAAYLEDNPDLAEALGFSGSLADSDGNAIEDIARKATGRMALMSVQVQKDFYAEVESQYNTLIEYLNSTNQNDLEPRTFDFEAQLENEVTLVEETDPSSPFGEAAVYGEYQIKAQGKQMTPEEVTAEAKKNLGDKGGREHVEAIIERLEKENPDMDREAARTGLDFMRRHHIGTPWRIEINGDVYNGVVTNLRNTHKKSGNPFAMSKIQVTLAVNGPLRSVTVPASQWARIEVGPLYGTNIETMFGEVVEGSEKAKIVTGNLLAAYGELTNTKGTVISFTKKDGSIEQGILLPKSFNYKLNTRGDFLFREAGDIVKFLSESQDPDTRRFGVASRDGAVRVLPRDGRIRIATPKSKARGGKYFLNKRLTDITGDFVSDGNSMVVTVPEAKAMDALRQLQSMSPLYAMPSQVTEVRQILGLPPVQIPDATDRPKFSRRKPQIETASLTFGEPHTSYVAFRPEQIKPANPDIRRSFAGRRALTSQPMALETAQLRIAGGEDPEVVRMETGWHRGNDGKWRYEISDDQASLAVPGQTFGDIHANAYANALADGRKQVTVADILHHDQLFAAYPALAEIPVSPMGEGERASARLQRRATGMAIQVQPGMRRSLVASALLHELQHGIQTIEGFARGGSAKNLASEFDRTGAETYRRLAGEVEARNTQTRQGMNAGMRKRIAPEMTADVPASDVIVTFNGRDIIRGPLPGNAQTRPAMTQGQILRAFQALFPKLVPAVRTMLSRGTEGKRGGLVLVDSADPLMIARAFSKKTGRPLTDTIRLFSEAGTINGFFDPQSGLTFLVTPNLDAATAPAVLLHEMVHGQQRRRIVERAAEMLMNRSKLKDPELRAFLDRVVERMIDAGESTNMEEAASYIVEQAVIEGRSQGYALADSRFLSWVDKTIGQRVGDLIRSMLASIRSWMLRNGMKPGEITVDDLVGYAMAGVERAARGRVDGGDVAFSRDAITNTPAFKRWFGRSLVTDDDGRPQVMYHASYNDFTEFNRMWSASVRRQSMDTVGSWFTDNPGEGGAEQYANGEGAIVYPVYLRIQRPKIYDRFDDFLRDMHEANGNRLEDMNPRGVGSPEALRERLKLQGYDGIAFTRTETQELIDEVGRRQAAIDRAYDEYRAAMREAEQRGAELDMSEARRRQAEIDRLTEQLRDAQRELGEAGRSTEFDNQYVWVAFDPEQIKSAIGNVGAYGQRPVTADEAAMFGMTQDEANNAQSRGDIRFSRTGVKQLASRATLELNHAFNAPGKLHWWHKTVGTMYNLAERSPAFKPVFEAAQGFIDDVAYYATDAAELAPKLLPRLETWRDILRRPISADDNKAINAPISEGTLVWARDGSGKPVRVDDLEAAAASMTTEQKVQALLDADKIPAGMLKDWQALPEDQFAKMIDSRYESQLMKPGVVWTDAELRSMFKLNDEQVALYREFRAATDRSLDTMARADMLRFVGDDAKDLRDAVMDAADVHEASRLLINHLQELSQAMPDRETQLMQLAHGIMERAERVRELQAEGYAPLSRFGKYTVDVVVDGERQYFGLFETRREANKMAEAMKAEFGARSVSQGTLSDESFKLFAGVTPETLELFGNMLGLDSTGDSAQDQAFQQYLRLTKTNRSAMRRLIHRKGIAGYSEDVGRVLASFVYSNARQTAAGLNIGQLGEAVNQIPKEQGELKDAAIRLSEYIKNPQEEAQAMRGLLFAQYLGGSVASAFVNLTQPVQVTFPWLSQYAGARGAAKEISRAVKQMSTRGYQYEPDLAQALKEAEDDGTVSPQEVHQMMAQARGSGSLRAGDGTRAGEARAFTSNQIARLSLAWGKMFGAAEQANRRITFIAAYRVARDKGMPDPGAFARRAVQETQFVYSKAAKMQWGRGAIGGTLMTFKTYTVSYIELMHRLWNQGEPGSEERREGRKAAMLMVATLMLMGGVGGLPFAEDLEDLIDGAAQLMGYNFSSRQAKEQFLRDVFGDAMGEFIEKGVSGLPGAPMDVSGRLGMGNLIPGTGLFTERTSHTRDVLEILGPGGDFANRILSGGRQILGGDVGAGLLEMSPVAVRNVAKGADMAVHGMYRDTKGYKVLDTDILDAALKAAGFQPAGVAKIQEANWINQRAKNFYNMQAQEIRALWATGIFEGDQAKVQRARDRVAEWNRKNPDQPMIIRIPDVMRRVREMGKTKDQRIAATAPRAMRAQMREDLARVRSEL